MTTRIQLAATCTIQAHQLTEGAFLLIRWNGLPCFREVVEVRDSGKPDPKGRFSTEFVVVTLRVEGSHGLQTCERVIAPDTEIEVLNWQETEALKLP